MHCLSFMKGAFTSFKHYSLHRWSDITLFKGMFHISHPKKVTILTISYLQLFKAELFTGSHLLLYIFKFRVSSIFSHVDTIRKVHLEGLVRNILTLSCSLGAHSSRSQECTVTKAEHRCNCTDRSENGGSWDVKPFPQQMWAHESKSLWLVAKKKKSTHSFDDKRVRNRSLTARKEGHLELTVHSLPIQGKLHIKWERGLWKWL